MWSDFCAILFFADGFPVFDSSCVLPSLDFVCSSTVRFHHGFHEGITRLIVRVFYSSPSPGAAPRRPVRKWSDSSDKDDESSKKPAKNDDKDKDSSSNKQVRCCCAVFLLRGCASK